MPYVCIQISHKILCDKWKDEKCKDDIDERQRIVEMAASIIRDDIRMSLYDCDIYPSINLTDQADESVPKSLSTLLKGILNPGDKSDTSMKRALTIAHSIIAACHPRSFISPILLSVAIYIHRRYMVPANLSIYSTVWV